MKLWKETMGVSPGEKRGKEGRQHVRHDVWIAHFILCFFCGVYID